MERSFIVTKDSKYHKDWQEYKTNLMKEKEFVKRFMESKSIESPYYTIMGNGFVNVPFDEWNKSNITLSIEPTENDYIKYGKILTKPSKHHGLCSFRKNSIIAKDFAQSCIDKEIIINLWKPRVSDYFKSLGYHGCSFQQFLHNDDIYIKIESEYLKDDDTPEGFIEIKLSEYYKVREKFEAIEGEAV